MQVTVEDVGPCRKKLTIEIPAESVSEAYRNVTKEYASAVEIRGFRRGRAPTKVVRSKYAKQITEEVRDRLVPRGYQDALERENLQPVAVLSLDEPALRDGEVFAYTVTCDIPPDFELPSYKGIQLSKGETEVPEEAVDEALERVREQHASYTDVERGVAEGDLVQVNYQAAVDGKPLDDVAGAPTGLGEGEEFWVLAEEQAFLPGFSQGLLGKSAGEHVDIQVVFPDDHPQEALRGVTADYAVDVLVVRCKELPDLDQEFFEKLQVESEAQLREQIQEQLAHHYADADQRRMKGEIVARLLEDTDLELPESVVQDETRSSIYQMVRDITSQGMSEEDVQEHKEQIFERASQSAADKVKIRYILERIADAEDIRIEQDEFQQLVTRMAARQGVETGQFLSYLREQNMVENVREDMRAEKTMDFLLEQATISV